MGGRMPAQSPVGAARVGRSPPSSATGPRPALLASTHTCMQLRCGANCAAASARRSTERTMRAPSPAQRGGGRAPSPLGCPAPLSSITASYSCPSSEWMGAWFSLPPPVLRAARTPRPQHAAWSSARCAPDRRLPCRCALAPAEPDATVTASRRPPLPPPPPPGLAGHNQGSPHGAARLQQRAD